MKKRKESFYKGMDSILVEKLKKEEAEEIEKDLLIKKKLMQQKQRLNKLMKSSN